jgi:hypothetical protein
MVRTDPSKTSADLKVEPPPKQTPPLKRNRRKLEATPNDRKREVRRRKILIAPPHTISTSCC